MSSDPQAEDEKFVIKSTIMKTITSFLIILLTPFTMAATEIKTQITINASPQEVWAVLTEFESYTSWNTFITQIEGEPTVGNRLAVQIDGMGFKPKVLVVEPQRALIWRGRLLLPGIFDGRHSFELIDNGDGTTTFVHSETFRGVLVPMLKKKLMTETRAGFERMNAELKERVEGVEN
jgi:hypothetical protein